MNQYVAENRNVLMLDMQNIIWVNPFLLLYLWMKQNWGAGAKQIRHELLPKKVSHRKLRNFPCPLKRRCLYVWKYSWNNFNYLFWKIKNLLSKLLSLLALKSFLCSCVLLSFLMTSVNYAKLKKERDADACCALGFVDLNYLTEVTGCKNTKYIASSSFW